jgi:dTDP-4-dehydrorhamnose 3,5-epimerase
MIYQSISKLGVEVYRSSLFSDKRGTYEVVFNRGVADDFVCVQDSIVRSKKNVLRGFHFHFQMNGYAQRKLVRCLSGRFVDVIVNLDPDSETFGQHEIFWLDARNDISLLIPNTCAHACFSLDDDSVLWYRVDCEYSPENECGFYPFSDIPGFPGWENITGVCEHDMIISDKDSLQDTYDEVLMVIQDQDFLLSNP